MQNPALAFAGIALLTIVAFTSGWWIGRTTTSDINHEARLARLEQQLADARAAAPAARPAAAPAPGGPPAVQKVDVGNAPSLGPKDAVVTVVEFSDFECPFCGRVNPALEELREAYPEQVRLVFKHFPLSIHRNAMGAHKASIAALQQGKFWEFHDWMFENRTKLDAASLRAQAEVLGLDMAKYDAAIADPKVEKQIKDDLAQGQSLGVRGTPSFFINGRFLSGAQPFAAFEEKVKEELERQG